MQKSVNTGKFSPNYEKELTNNGKTIPTDCKGVFNFAQQRDILLEALLTGNNLYGLADYLNHHFYFTGCDY